MSNDDTLSLDEAISQASDSLTTQPEEADKEQAKEPVLESQESEPSDKDESTKEEAAQPDGEEEKAETAEEETFLDKVPSFNDLPEPMQKIYKHWQTQYTNKRQSEREYIRELEAKLEKSTKIDQPESQKQAQVQQMKRDNPSLTLQDIDALLDNREQNRYIETQEKQFFEVDSRLKEDSPDFDDFLFEGVTGKLSKEREDYIAKNGTIIGYDFVGRAKELINNYDKKLKQASSEAIKERAEKGKQMFNQHQKENPKAKSLEGKTQKKLDLDDAVDLAFSKMR